MIACRRKVKSSTDRRTLDPYWNFDADLCSDLLQVFSLIASPFLEDEFIELELSVWNESQPYEFLGVVHFDIQKLMSEKVPPPLFSYAERKESHKPRSSVGLSGTAKLVLDLSISSTSHERLSYVLLRYLYVSQSPSEILVISPFILIVQDGACNWRSIGGDCLHVHRLQTHCT